MTGVSRLSDASKLLSRLYQLYHGLLHLSITNPLFINIASSTTFFSRRTHAFDRLRFTSNMQTFASLIAAWFAIGFFVCRVCPSSLHRDAMLSVPPNFPYFLMDQYLYVSFGVYRL
jgi:hypothetical protein